MFITSFEEQNITYRSCSNFRIHLSMTHMCVDAAVRAASDFGYKVKVIHDACATLDLEFNGVKVPAGHVHATLMAAFEFAYAQVISTEDYVS